MSDGDAPEALSADPAEEGGAAGAAATNDAPAEDPAEAEPEPPRQTVTRPGDLWLLGEHRLLCGDSTDAASVSRVMGDDRAALLFTSPPYGSQRDYTTGGVTDWDALMQGVFQHLDAAMRTDGQVLVNLGLIHREGEWQPYWQGWLDWARAQGWRRFGLYAWDHGPGLPGDWNGRLAPPEDRLGLRGLYAEPIFLTLVPYYHAVQVQAAERLAALPQGSVLARMIDDYRDLPARIRGACRRRARLR